MMNDEYRVVLTGNRTVKFVDLEVHAIVHIVYDAETHQVWHFPRRHYYGGQGQPWLYAESEYWIVELVRLEENCIVCKRIRHAEPKHSWKTCLKEFAQLADELSNKTI